MGKCHGAIVLRQADACSSFVAGSVRWAMIACRERRKCIGGSQARLVRLALLLCTMFICGYANDAEAQSIARDVLRRQLTSPATTVPMPKALVTSASEIAEWKKITIGAFKDSFALLNALTAMSCGIGDSAAAALARPTFGVAATKTTVSLLTVTAADLGFQGETAPLRQIYRVAQRMGFVLAPAEVAPQLRLQYQDQPVGEFLIIAMEPIRTWAGEAVILTVANGGAGLILIGQDGDDEADIPVTSRFVFVRSPPGAPTLAGKN
ncbi:hypothetical protein JQ543_11950 [Bradyrhizobium diazoefficiens]|nr:hypothetical protein [Bradyrhizobium diazoefficiens]